MAAGDLCSGPSLCCRGGGGGHRLTRRHCRLLRKETEGVGVVAAVVVLVVTERGKEKRGWVLLSPLLLPMPPMEETGDDGGRPVQGRRGLGDGWGCCWGWGVCSIVAR